MALLLGLAAGTVRATVLYVEEFNADPGWVDRDAGEMTSGYTSGYGNPSGSLQGSYDPLGAPSPDSDAFRANAGSSGGAFSGNYYGSYTNFTSFTFDLYADTVLPSDVIIRVSDGTYVFTYGVSAQVDQLGAWNSVTVPLTYGGWTGGTQSQFTNLLGGVTYVDVQVTRNGIGGQNYYLDNFAINYNDPLLAVPEPSTAITLFGVALLLLLRGRHLASLPGIKDERAA